MSVFSAFLSDGPRSLGPLADRGAFDQYAQYRPGQVVVDDGVVYLNIAAIGAAPELEDTFGRRDQDGWGQSSHGEAWTEPAGFLSDMPGRLVNGVGLLAQVGESVPNGQLLGPSRLRADAELLLGLSLALPGPTNDDVVQIGLNATEDGVSLAGVKVHFADDGTSGLVMQATTPGFEDADSSSAPGPTVADGAPLWLRLRRVGLVYTATLWAAGQPEPASAQNTLTASHAQPPGHPVLAPFNLTGEGALALRYLSLRALTAADAPADDTDHWVALADALQVAPPL